MIDSKLVFDLLPVLAVLPKLLQVEKLILDLKLTSWRLRGLPPLWPKSLKVIEMFCRNWTIPFAIPGLHHIVHLCRRTSPFPYNTTSPWKGSCNDSGSGQENAEEWGYKMEVMSTLKWMANSIIMCSMREKNEGTKMSTWEIRVKYGGKDKVEWAEEKVVEMLEAAGLGGVGDDEIVSEGGMRIDRFKIVVDDEASDRIDLM
jgi:hypothetical protein